MRECRYCKGEGTVYVDDAEGIEPYVNCPICLGTKRVSITCRCGKFTAAPPVFFDELNGFVDANGTIHHYLQCDDVRTP